MKILIFGASGSGTTTLGQEIEKRSNFKHLDVDSYYWKKTDPPFQEKIPLTHRNKHLKTDFNAHKQVVVSGSLVSWGDEWNTAFDLAIFIRLDNMERMERLRKRETERYGDQLLVNKKIQRTSKAFLAWADQYENQNFKGRSLKVHLAWMDKLHCEVLIMDGATPLYKKVQLVLAKVKLL